MGVVDAGAMEVVGGARARGCKSCFLGLPLHSPAPDVCLAINDLYNIYKIENARHVLTK